MNPVIKATNELKSLINTTVGYVKINKSWIHHNASFECAAWWEDSSIQEGVYPLILKQSHLAPYDLYLSAALESIVVDDYFPALWGGVAISDKPYVAKNIGSKRTVHHRFDLVESIEKTGAIPGSKMDICVNPLIWSALISAARASLIEYQDTYNKYLADYQEVGDGSFDTNIGMIAYAAEHIAVLARSISKIKHQYAYLNEKNDYMRNLFANNISWVQAA